MKKRLTEEEASVVEYVLDRVYRNMSFDENLNRWCDDGDVLVCMDKGAMDTLMRVLKKEESK